MRKIIIVGLTVLMMAVIPNVVMGQWTDFAFGRSGYYYGYSDYGYGGYGYYGGSKAAQIIGASSSSLARLLAVGANWKRVTAADRHMERQDEIVDRHLERQDGAINQALENQRLTTGLDYQKREEIPQDVLDSFILELKELRGTKETPSNKAYRSAYRVYMEEIHINGECQQEAFRKAMRTLKRENLNCYDKLLEELFN